MLRSCVLRYATYADVIRCLQLGAFLHSLVHGIARYLASPPSIGGALQYSFCAAMQVQKSKAGTGRVVGFRELGLVNAYTMEASFAGAAVGKHAKQHFNTGA